MFTVYQPPPRCRCRKPAEPASTLTRTYNTECQRHTLFFFRPSNSSVIERHYSRRLNAANREGYFSFSAMHVIMRLDSDI
jgi:hypothetical protein